MQDAQVKKSLPQYPEFRNNPENFAHAKNEDPDVMSHIQCAGTEPSQKHLRTKVTSSIEQKSSFPLWE